MDLAALDTRKGAEEGCEIQLSHPNSGKPLEIWITVFGADSEQYQGTLRSQQRKRMDRMAKRKVPSPEDLEDDVHELLAAATGGWRTGDGIKIDGQPFPEFSRAAAKKLYARFPWIREQVDAAMADRANFFPKSASA